MIRQEMFKDFTFRPTIKPMPKFYGVVATDASPFYTRVTKWKKDVEREQEQRKVKLERASMQDCTFYPKSSHSLAKLAQFNGSSDGGSPDGEEDTNERLYRNFQVIRAEREQERETALLLRQQREAQDCTFAPHRKNINTKYLEVKPKFAEALSKPDYEELKVKLETRGCTFTPKIKGVKPNMSSAKLYTSVSVVDRLTGTTPGGAGGTQRGGNSTSNQSFDYFNLAGDKAPVDISSFMGSMSSTNKRYGAANDRPASASATKKKAVDDSKGFIEFLGRNTQTQLKTQREIDEIIRNSTPDFTPELCKKSLLMSERNAKGAFLDRVERDYLRRLDNEVNLAKMVVDKEATFTPQISSKAAKLQGRSTVEMSVHDYRRYEHKHRMLKHRTEQAKMAGSTFTPELSRYAQHAKSTFALAEENNMTLSEMYKYNTSKLESRRKVMAEQRDQEVLAECTFEPETSKCPEYIKRIAKSMSIVRAAKQAETEKSQVRMEKPLWK